MKRIIYKTLIFAGLLATSCTDLDVPIKSSYTSDIFPRNEQEFIAITGPVYAHLRNKLATDYYALQEYSTDEAVLTARGADYYDGGRYLQLNLHTWDETHPFIPQVWTWGYKGISLCGEIIASLETTPDSDFKNKVIAEMRTMRALYYFMVMDLFGNVPITPPYGSIELPGNSSRADVFNYIENELKESIAGLSGEVSVATYGRPTKSMAYALLAKLYLNAEVYTGQARYNEAIEACNQVIFADVNGDNTPDNPFALEPNYLKIFDIDNGPQVKEIIFGVPYDQNFNANGMWLARFPLHPLLRTKYGLPTTISVGNCLSTWSEFYSLYNEQSDVRHSMWLAGPQFHNDGKPVMDGSFHVTFIPEISFNNVATFDRGRDPASIAEGIRNLKYSPDPTWTSSRDSRNDFVLFRYADVLLMKAEAILRGGTDSGPQVQTALELVNSVRSIRQVQPFESVDLENLFEERGREMAFETWRRNDLIRFGQWEKPWGTDAATGNRVKTNSDVNRRIYPIPQNELASNPKLVQNPGY